MDEGVLEKAGNSLRKDIISLKENQNEISNAESDGARSQKNKYLFAFKPEEMGEHKIVFIFSDSTEDFIVLNVMDDLEKVMEERVAYICDELFTGENGNPAYAFTPISNQGESLGKANLVLKKNLLGTLDVEQVRKVEQCANSYVRPKWFIDGDFRKPRKL